MLGLLQRQWFLFALVTLIATGTLVGARGYGPYVKPLADLLNPTVATACTLFLMAFSLEPGKLLTALKSPLSVVVGFSMNLGLIPLLAWGLSAFQHIEDFRFGLMIAASVPSTLAAAAVITRKAGGNDAVSLLITMATNLSCFLLTPLWLKVSTGAEIPIDSQEMMVKLLLTVLTPTLAGQGLRLAGQMIPVLKPLHEFATYRKQQIAITAQLLIVAVVFTAALRAGMALHTHGSTLSLISVAVVWGSCVITHMAAITCGLSLSHLLRLPTDVADAVGFAGSQKTLPIGAYIASLDVFKEFPFVMLPMLLFHASQLFLDTLIAGYLADRAKTAQANAPAAAGVPAP
jgi:sodium/bile acid cotransporter 7